jgi:PIN domain nuclease of toxin-antitoxin system
MKFLLDTHILIWYLVGNPNLRMGDAEAIEDTTNQILVSQTSLWEISIKVRIGKLEAPLGMTFQQLEQHLIGLKFSLLGLKASHFDALLQLPMHHRDPFDRLLVAQSLVEQAKLLTDDAQIAPYFQGGETK